MKIQTVTIYRAKEVRQHRDIISTSYIILGLTESSGELYYTFSYKSPALDQGSQNGLLTERHHRIKCLGFLKVRITLRKGTTGAWWESLLLTQAWAPLPYYTSAWSILLQDRGAAGPAAPSRQGARSTSNWTSSSWSGILPLSSPTHNHRQPLTAFLLVTLVEAVRQPVTLPGTRDAPPVAAHEVTWDVALVGEVVPREQLALCVCEREREQSEASIVITVRAEAWASCKD